MRHAALWIAALLLNSASAAAQTRSDRLHELVAQAQTAEQQDRLDDAVSLYRQILRIRPAWASAELNLGLVHHSRRDWASAIRVLSGALRHDPKLHSALLFRGGSYFQTGEFDKCVQDLLRYLAHKPGDSEALALLATAQMARGDLPHAALAYAKLASGDGQAGVWFQLGEVYGQIARHSIQSLSASERDRLIGSGAAAQCAPPCVTSFEDATRRLIEQSRNPAMAGQVADGYRRLANAAISNIKPESAWGFLVRAQAADLAGNGEQARKDFELAISAPDAEPEMLVRFGQFECKHSRFDACLSRYEKALSLDSGNARIRGLIGEVLALQDRPDQAIPFLESVLKANPRETQARLYLAQCLVKINRPKDAIRVLEAAPDDHDGRVHYLLGRTYQQQGLEHKARLALKVYRERRAKRGP